MDSCKLAYTHSFYIYTIFLSAQLNLSFMSIHLRFTLDATILSISHTPNRLKTSLSDFKKIVSSLFLAHSEFVDVFIDSS